MSDNINMSPRGLVIDGAIFIDEMLSCVHGGYYGAPRVSLIPAIYRNTYRVIIDHMYDHEFGKAIVKRLQILPRNHAAHAAHLTAVANDVGFKQSAARVHLSDLLSLHEGSRLTDENFRSDHHSWSSKLFDWFALLAIVCFHLERNYESNELLRAFIVAGEILCNVMSGRPIRKMSRLIEYARIFTSTNPRQIMNS